jgi:hypothetical protein
MAAFQHGGLHLSAKTSTISADTGWIRLMAKTDGYFYKVDSNNTNTIIGDILKSEVALVTGSLQTQINSISGGTSSSGGITGAYVSYVNNLSGNISILAGSGIGVSGIGQTLTFSVTGSFGDASLRSEVGIVTGSLQSQINNAVSNNTTQYTQISSISSQNVFQDTQITQLQSITGNYTTLVSTALLTGNLQTQITSAVSNNVTQYSQIAAISSQNSFQDTQIANLQSITGNYTTLATTTILTGGINTRLTTVENAYATKATTTPGTFNNVVVNSQGIVTSGGNLNYALTASIPTSATFLSDYDNRYVNISGDTMTGSLSITGANLNLDQYKLYRTTSAGFDGVIVETNTAGANSQLKSYCSSNGNASAIYSQSVGGATAQMVAGGGTFASNMFGISRAGGVDFTANGATNVFYGSFQSGTPIYFGQGQNNADGVKAVITSAGQFKIYFGTVIADISGTNGNIVTHDAAGKLTDSGILATSLASTSTVASISANAAIDNLDVILEGPSIRSYDFAYRINYPGTITNAYYTVETGAVSASVTINGNNVAGLTALSMGTSSATAISGNTFAIGDRIRLNVTNVTPGTQYSTMSLRIVRN